MSGTLQPPFASHFDGNQIPSIMGVVGTLGTSDQAGTANPIPIGVDPATGAAYVYNLGPAGSVTLGNTPGGTLNEIGTVLGVGGVVQVSGTVSTGGAGTQPVSFTNDPLGSVVVTAGTVTTSLALNTGTITTIAAGTQNTLGTVGVVNNVVKGTVTALESGTLTALAVGTVGGKAASGAAAINNPILIAGTDGGGTVYAPLISAGGAVSIAGAVTLGTLAGLGTLTNLGSISNIGSLTNFGTGKEITNLVGGTITALATGTITAGTVAITAGTVGGKAASGAAAVANPVQIAGTDAGGTIYSPLVSTAGALTTNLTSSGTLLNLANGTLASAGTTTGVGTITNLGSVTNVGTIKEVTTVPTVTTVSNVTAGSFVQTAGTLTLGTLTNLVSGTINALASGTITGGTLGNLNYGTVNIDPRPIAIAPLTFGTLGTAGGSFFGTISAASGAGTKHYISGISVVGQSGTADVRILAGTSIQGTGVLGAGYVVPGGGYVRNLTIPFVTGTNSELTYHFVGAGTAFIIISYWKGV